MDNQDDMHDTESDENDIGHDAVIDLPPADENATGYEGEEDQDDHRETDTSGAGMPSDTANSDQEMNPDGTPKNPEDGTDAPPADDSFWVRVAQGMAGQTWGTLFIPRVGQEVIIQFINGDPDQPIVTGAVYNSTHRPPYMANPLMTSIRGHSALPMNDTEPLAHHMESFDRGEMPQPDVPPEQKMDANEITFDDTKGEESILIHAQKDMAVIVENDQSVEVRNNQGVVVKKNRSVDIGGLMDSYSFSKALRTSDITLGLDMYGLLAGIRMEDVLLGMDSRDVMFGRQSFSVTMGTQRFSAPTQIFEVSTMRSVNVAGVETHKNGAAYTHNAVGPITIKSAAMIVLEAPMIQIKGQLMAKVKGGLMAQEEGGAMGMVKGAMAKVGGGAVSIGP